MKKEELRKIAALVRQYIWKMIYLAGSGHPGGSLSCVEILVALYFGGILKYDPKNPKWPKRDRFVLSKAHACPTLYTILSLAGFFLEEELWNLRKLGSILQGHPDMKSTPGVEMSSGRLGQGLSFGCGIALGVRGLGENSRIYVLIGDGESQKGQIKEAAVDASVKKLSNLCAILDCNKYQIDGSTKRVDKTDPEKLWKAYGWNVISCDGHDFKQLFDAFAQAKAYKIGPTIIIARTVKGKGIPPAEHDKIRFHGKAPTKQEFEETTGGLERACSGYTKEDAKKLIPPRKTAKIRPVKPFITPEKSHYGIGEMIPTRLPFGIYLHKLAHDKRIWFGSADLTDSCQLGKLKETYPDQYIPCGITEAHLASLASGLTTLGIFPWIATFDVFSEEMSSQITMAAYMQLPVVFVYTHAGLGVSKDGDSHQSKVEPIKIRDLPNMLYFEPADANETEGLMSEIVRLAQQGKGPFYLRLTRHALPVLDRGLNPKPEQGAYVIREAENPKIILVGSGAGVAQIIEAHNKLSKEDIPSRVINATRLDLVGEGKTPLLDFLVPNVPVITVQDASLYCLGDAVSRVITSQGLPIKVVPLGISGFGQSGEVEELYRHYGFDAESIAAKAKEVI